MPITPFHFGPALAVRAAVGHKAFGIWAFTATQVMLDMEPAIRMFFDLDGTLHQTTHNMTYGLIYAAIAAAALWKWERWGAVVGALFGSLSHLWLDAMYHADVAALMAKWPTYNPRDGATAAEAICYMGFLFWALFAGIRKVVTHCLEKDGLALPASCAASSAMFDES